jgi:hypothetical protein
MPSLAETLEPGGTPGPQVCAFVRKNGLGCGRPVNEDEEYCIVHGASIVRSQEVIQRRLLALQEKCIYVLEEILDFADQKTQLAAVVAVMDRTGLGPKSTIAVEKSTDLSHLTFQELNAELDRLKQIAQDEAARQAPVEYPTTDTVN